MNSHKHIHDQHILFSSIRAQFGVDIKANAVHGPSTEDNAKQVIQEVFGDLQTKTDGSVDAGERQIWSDFDSPYNSYS